MEDDLNYLGRWKIKSVLFRFSCIAKIMLHSLINIIINHINTEKSEEVKVDVEHTEDIKYMN